MACNEGESAAALSVLSCLNAQNTRARARAGGTNQTQRAPRSNQHAAGCAGAISSQPAESGTHQTHATVRVSFPVFSPLPVRVCPCYCEHPGALQSFPESLPLTGPIKGSVASCFQFNEKGGLRYRSRRARSRRSTVRGRATDSRVFLHQRGRQLHGGAKSSAATKAQAPRPVRQAPPAPRCCQHLVELV